jgi:hypothetical protein
MLNARKGADPRFALHCATVDPVAGAESQWPGQTKISGRAIPAGAIEGPDGDSFRADIADIAEVGHTRLSVVDTRARVAKDRPRVTVEPGPGPGHERDPSW